MYNSIPEIKISYSNSSSNLPVLNNSASTYLFLLDLFDINTIELKEEAICLYLNRSNRLIGWHRLSSGGIQATVVDIRIILGIALKCAASFIILSHNHPSGKLSPSLQDRELTSKLKEAGRLMDFQLLDHLIVHPSGYFSFSDEGVL